MRKTAYERARVYGSVRSAHLERAHALPPASILHRRFRYDFDPQLAEGLDLVRGSIPSLAVTLLRSRLAGLEVNEPLLRSGLAKTAVVVTAARWGARLHRRQLLVVSYAIENRDNFAEELPRLRSRVRRRLDWSLTRFVTRRIDRIAYGTSAAADLYADRLGGLLDGAQTAVVPAVPAPCDCATADRDPDGVVFLGALDDRKGFRQLAAAWPEVGRLHPGARLTVIGKGRLAELAAQVAAEQPGVTLVLDPPRAEIHRLLRGSAVLVLLSQPSPTWREQVGLPLVEGLAHGCSVVATTETGLAGWLAGHGHDVLDPADGPAEVARRVAGALARRRSAESVLADLPAEDGRLAADRWLFAPLAGD